MAAGFYVQAADEFLPTLEKALEMEKPVLIAVDVDYSHNRCGGFLRDFPVWLLLSAFLHPRY